MKTLHVLLACLAGLQLCCAVIEYELVYGSVLASPTHANASGNFTFPGLNRTRESWINSANLYFTLDGVAPYSLVYTDNHQCYSIKALLGQLYYQFAVSLDTHYHNIVSVDGHSHSHGYKHSSFSRDLCPCYCTCPNQETNHFRWQRFQVNPMQVSASYLRCGIPGRRTDGVSLSVVTYNIWNVNSTENQSSRARLKGLGELLASSNFDVIALQEVRLEVGSANGGTVYQMKQLQKHLPGYQYVFQPAMLLSAHPRVEEGVAVFSKYPILSSDYLMLPWNESDPNDFHQRICLHVSVFTPFGEIQVFNTHLSLGHEAQLRSVVAIWEYMAMFPGPALLLGDFNAEPDSDTIRFLAGEMSVKGERTAGLVDTWPLTQGQGNGFTFSSLGTPSKKIDYIWIRISEADSLCLSTSQLLGTCHNPPLSDHYGLAVTLLSTKRSL